MPEIIQTIFWGLLMLMLIVFVHELGHFLAARMFGVRVKEFMLGLPGPSIGFTRGNTRYGITCVPLGGYARIVGMEGGPENPHLPEAAAYLAYFGALSLEEVRRSSEKLGFDLEEALDVLDEWGTIVRNREAGDEYQYEMPFAFFNGHVYSEGEPRLIGDPAVFIAKERSQTYRSLSWWKRLVVLAAGAAFNLIFAILVISVVMIYAGEYVSTTTVEAVNEASPAQKAGIQSGDVLLSVDDQLFENWQDITAAITNHAPGDTVRVGYQREGKLHSAEVVLAAASDDNRAILGVTSHLEHQAISPLDALGTSVGFIGYVATVILQLFNPATFQETISQSSSVVGVSVEARNAAAAGFLPFMILTAALSISIGLMNLLPLPPLDGGKMVVETIQRLTHRYIPVRVINGLSLAGIALLVVLFMVCTSQDIQRYFLGG